MNNLKIQKNKDLKKLTTFKIGGKAKYFIPVKNKKELKQACQFAKQKKLPIFTLGGGSNILISDKKLNALVIKLVNKNLITKNNKLSSILITAGSGIIWDDLVKKTINLNLQGLECLSGIPGSVGASPVQNIGAYGQEIKDSFYNLTAYNIKEEKFVNFNKKQLKFSYRHSIFKEKKYKNNYIIFSVTFKLHKNKQPSANYQSLQNYFIKKKINKPCLKDIRKAVLNIRKQRLEDPNKNPNAGSFFKNPIISFSKFSKLQKKYPNIPNFPEKNKIKMSAGWLIEQSGFKGKKYKNVSVSSKNALIITNPQQQSTSKEIINLSIKIQKKVYKKFDIHINPEVQFINFS
jgi:UDP-N-acetylmuramate dehydrogenase